MTVVNTNVTYISYSQNTECDQYMMHPVNTFHSLVRISIWLPRLVKLPQKYLQTLANPMKIEQQAASGLANVQDFHDLDITKLAVDGTFQDPITKEVFKAATNMTPHELFVVTKTVVQLDDFETLDNNIAWAQAAFVFSFVSRCLG